MSLLDLFLTAVALSMDAFAVAIGKGLSMKKLLRSHAVIIGLWFGIFQALMPVLGYYLGASFRNLVASIDHWIAFILLSLIGAALGICNLVTASVMERSAEIGLMKAVGAHNGAITLLILAEITVTTIIGGIVGYFAGFGLAQVIGQTVFGSAITMRTMVIPIVAVLIILVTLAGSIPAIRAIARMDPTEVLHGK